MFLVSKIHEGDLIVFEKVFQSKFLNSFHSVRIIKASASFTASKIELQEIQPDSSEDSLIICFELSSDSI